MTTALITGVAGQDGSFLAVQSHVTVSLELPEFTAVRAPHILPALRMTGLGARFYQASPSEKVGPGSSQRSQF